jgi:hypothetical protein
VLRGAVAATRAAAKTWAEASDYPGCDIMPSILALLVFRALRRDANTCTLMMVVQPS